MRSARSCWDMPMRVRAAVIRFPIMLSTLAGNGRQVQSLDRMHMNVHTYVPSLTVISYCPVMTRMDESEIVAHIANGAAPQLVARSLMVRGRRASTRGR